VNIVANRQKLLLGMFLAVIATGMAVQILLARQLLILDSLSFDTLDRFLSVILFVNWESA
jgi:hypothetical protein